MNINIIPQFFIERLQKQYGEDLSYTILKGFEVKRKTTLRINTIKTNSETIKKQLNDNNIEYEEVEWSKDALLLKNADEKDIQNLKIYEDGEIYLQSFSSMLPPIVLAPKQGENILDMTAAPGGKTTQMAAIANNKALITACERNRRTI